MRLKDLPISGQTVQLWWRKRRLVCGEDVVSAQDVHPDIGCGAVACPSHRAAAASGGDGDRIEQPGRLRCGPRVRRVVADRAQGAGRRGGPSGCPNREPTSRLGIDETRFRSVRWILDGITWRRSDPWLTSFVDCSRDGPGSLLGLAPGRTGACVREWLARAIRRVPEDDQDRGDRPVGAVCVRDPRRAAGCQDRSRQMALGRAGQPDGHRGPATRHPRPAGPTRHGRRPGVGEPATAAHRRRTPLAEAVAAARCHARQLRPDRRDWRRLGCEGTAPDAARRVGAVQDPVAAGRLLRRRDRRPAARRPPGSPKPSRPGGQPSWSPSPRTPPTPAPKDSTASSSKPNGSAAATAT